MRWQELFDDLEGQLDAAADAELAAEVADRGRRELSALRFIDRLRAARGEDVVLRVRGTGVVEGRLATVGPDWLLVGESAGGSAPTAHQEALVAIAAIVSMTGLVAQSAAPLPQTAVEARLRLGYALRGVVRDRSPVTVFLVDGSIATGTFDRVGNDFVELAEHLPGEVRRRGAVRMVRTIPLHGLAMVRRA